MGVRVPVLSAGYWQFGVSIYTQHDQCFPPPSPIPAVPGLMEGPAFMGAAPGAAIAHKKAPTVLVDGAPGVQQGHDVGYIIPHIAGPPNALMALHTLFSKHKVMLPVESVLLEGRPVGSYLFNTFGLICSNPISIPAGCLVQIKGTVFTSATWSDFLKLIGYLALEVVTDWLWNKLKKAIPAVMKPSPWNDRVEKWISDQGVKGIGLFNIHVLGLIELEHGRSELFSRFVYAIFKGWAFSPIVGGGARGAPGVGRGSYNWKPKFELEVPAPMDAPLLAPPNSPPKVDIDGKEKW